MKNRREGIPQGKENPSKAALLRISLLSSCKSDEAREFEREIEGFTKR